MSFGPSLTRSQCWIYAQQSVKTQATDPPFHGHPVYKRVAQFCAPGFFRWGLSLGTTSAPHKAVRGLRASPVEQKALHLAIGSPPSMAVSESVLGGPAPCAFRGWSRVGVRTQLKIPRPRPNEAQALCQNLCLPKACLKGFNTVTT